MRYDYQGNSYEKRAVTEHIVVQVIDNNYSNVKNRDEAYKEKAASIKNAEAAGQADACPVFGRDELRAVTSLLRETVDGFRVRTAQLGTAVSVERLEDVTEEDALYQIANGSTVNFALSYSEEAVKNLLKSGILPLVTKEPLPAGTYIGILNIRQDLEQGVKKLDAYVLTAGRKEPVSVETADFTIDQLDRVLN